MQKSLILSMMISMLILAIFFVASKKEKWDKLKNSNFECGFTSYYFSRFVFSIHYLMVALIFLFLDLELCFLMPFLNESTSNLTLIKYLSIFVSVLLLGLFMEWKTKKMEWVD